MKILVDRDGDWLKIVFDQAGKQPVTLNFDRKNARLVIDAMETQLARMTDAAWEIEDARGRST